MKLSFIKSELDNGNPIAAAVSWWDQGSSSFLNIGHSVLITGILKISGLEYLVINDPTDGVSILTFENFITGHYAGKGYWTQAITTVANNSLIGHDEDLNIKHGGFRLVKKEGTMEVCEDTGNDDFYKLIPKTKKIYATDIVFNHQGDVTIHTPVPLTEPIKQKNPTEDYAPRPPYKFAVETENNSWKVVVKDRVGAELYNISSLFTIKAPPAS